MTSTDPMAGRAMTEGEAKSLLREAVRLNILSKGQFNRFFDELEGVVERLVQAGKPCNYEDYQRPSDVV